MRTRPTLRRGLALTTATALLTSGLAGLAAAPALAFPGTPTVTGFSPDQWDNRSQVTLGVDGTGFFDSDQSGITRDLVYLTPDAGTTSGPEVSEFFVTAQPSNSTTHLTARFNLAKVPPGKYRVSVEDFNGSRSNYAPGFFTVYAYGGANASGSVFGANSSACDVSTCASRGSRPLDISGSNISVGAKVNFLKPGATPSSPKVVDPGMSFVQGNPNHTSNDLGEGTNGTAGNDGSGYVSTSLLQGNYAVTADDQNGATFTPGWHDLQIVNTDGNTSGTTSRFSQQWFPDKTQSTSPISPTGVGKGSTGTVITLTATGIREGSVLTVESHPTTNPACADITVGPSTVSDPKPDGTYGKISAPVSMASCSTNNNARAVGVLGPDGASYSRAGLLSIVPPPAIEVPALTSGFETLGQGARIGYDGEEVDIFGTGFQGDPAHPHEPGGDVDKMTKFSFGEGVTVTTVMVGIGYAQVRIDVANDAPLGDRTLTAINPDGGQVTSDGDDGNPLTNPLGDPPPLTIEAGPQVTNVNPAGLPPSTTNGAVSVVVTGTFTTADSFVAKVCQHNGTLDCTETPGVTEASVTDTATTLTFDVSTLNAPAGLKDLVITDTTNRGRLYCAGCIGIDSLGLGAPTSVPNTGPTTLSFTGTDIDDVTSASTATLTRLVALVGQGPITQTGTLTPGSVGSDAASGTFDLTGVAPGKYSITVVKDPGSANPTEWTCTGCLTVTGAAITTTAITREPGAKAASAGQGATGVQLKIVGTNFVKGVQVSIPDVTVDQLTIVSPTELALVVSVRDDAPVASKTVTVTSGDGVGPNTGSKTTNLSMNVTAKPSNLSAPSPAALAQGAGTAGYLAAPAGAAATITITGDGFADDATLDLGPGITVTNPHVTQGSAGTPPIIPATPDSLTATVSIPEDAVVGKRALAVVNGDGGRTSVADAFTVNDGPKPLSVANANGVAVLAPDGVAHTVTVLGSGFATSPAATLKVVPDTGVTIANVVVAAGKITADVTVASDAQTGARSLGVTNSGDKGYGSIAVYVAKLPSAPASLVLTPLGSALKATWTAPGNNGGAPVTGYHLTLQRVGSTAKTLRDVSGSTLTTTFTGLTNGASYSIAVNAVNLVGGGPAITRVGVAGIVTTLTSAASSTTSTAGLSLRYSGKLAAGSVGVGGRIIALRFTPQVGSPFTVNVRTNSVGNWAYVRTMVYTMSMRPSFAGDSTYRSSIGAVRTVTVRSKVVVASPGSSSTSSAGTTLKVTGYVYPNKRGQYVYLYRFSGSTRTLLAKALLSSSSTYTFSGRLARGTYTLRVYIPNTKGNVANYSPAFTVKRV